MNRIYTRYASLKHNGKKLLLLTGLTAGFSTTIFAQTKIGDNPATPRDPSAMLEVSSTNTPFRGFLMPRLTTAQRDAMTAPAKGLMIFNTTTNQLEVNTGTTATPAWSSPSGPLANAWLLGGNAGINAATSFLGTTDAQPLVFRTNNTEYMRLNANGTLGVGTTLSNSKLSIVTSAGNGLMVQAPAIALASIPFTVHTTPGSDNSGVAIRINSLQTGAVGNLDMGVLPGQAGSLQMYQQPGNTPGPIALNALSGGNVGIGTVTPAQKLDVAGTARISGSDGTPTTITGRDADGDIGNVTLGAGLSLSGGVLNTTAAAGWRLAGNTATDPSTNFIGTTDAQPVVLRTNNLEQMRVTSAGNIGIGSSNPNAKLTVVAPSGNGMVVQAPAIALSSIPFVVQTTAASNNSGVAMRINSLQTGSVGNLDMGVLTGQIGSLQMYKQPGNAPGDLVLNAIAGGNVGIGTTAPTALLSVNGTANNTTGVWGIFSDDRIKEIDAEFTDGLETVLKIRPVKFHYTEKAPFPSTEQQIGIVAQEIEAIAPYMVNKVKVGSYNDLRQYNAQALPYLLVNAIQELKKELDSVRTENEKLRAELAGMSNRKPAEDDTAGLLARIKKLEEALGVASR